MRTAITRHPLLPIWLCAALLVSGCGGGGSDNNPAPPANGGGTAPPPEPEVDFSQADTAFQNFLDNNAVFNGISYVVVDAGGTLHTATFGDHTEETVVMLASTSKVPAVMTLMALAEDADASFDINQPIGEVLPFDGVYADRTPAQLVSNTSGIPGLRQLAVYGPHLCQYSFDDAINFEACGEDAAQRAAP
jgi:CubicO group peptidase (beta-lactamase class C family)